MYKKSFIPDSPPHKQNNKNGKIFNLKTVLLQTKKWVDDGRCKRHILSRRFFLLCPRLWFFIHIRQIDYRSSVFLVSLATVIVLTNYVINTQRRYLCKTKFYSVRKIWKKTIPSSFHKDRCYHLQFRIEYILTSNWIQTY